MADNDKHNNNDETGKDIASVSLVVRDESINAANTKNGNEENLKQRPAKYCGENDGEQLLPLTAQWAICSIILIIAIWRVSDESKNSYLLGGATHNDTYIVLDVVVPIILALLAYTLSFSFAKGVPDQKVIRLIVLYIILANVSFALGCFTQFIVGSSCAAIFPFYFVVQFLASKPGKEGAKYDYGKYSFLAPIAIGFYNAFGFLVAKSILNNNLKDSTLQWKIAALVGSAITTIVGKLTGAYQFSITQYLRYWLGQIGLYLFVFLGAIQWVEQGLLKELEGYYIATDVTTSVSVANNNNETAVTTSTKVSSIVVKKTSIEVFNTWHLPISWIAIGLWALYWLIRFNVPCGVAKEVCGCCCKRDENFYDPNIVRRAGCFRWFYWSCGVIVGTFLLCAALPEALLGNSREWGGCHYYLLLVWKVILGIGMIRVHAAMMAGRLLEKNDKFLGKKKGKGAERLTDTSWRVMKSICQLVILLHVAIFFSVWISIKDERPFIIELCDLLAILFLAVIGTVRLVMYLFHCNEHFFIVRRKNQPWNESAIEANSHADVFIRMFAPIQIDRVTIQNKIISRLNYSHHLATWRLRKDGTPMRMNEIMLRLYDILSEPKTIRLDTHTRCFMLLAKTMVVQCRKTVLDTSDIKLPFEKFGTDELPKFTSAIANIEFAKSDEFYSGSKHDLSANFAWYGKLMLDMIAHLNVVTNPCYFDDEFEGVVMLEAVARNYMPAPPSHPWPEMRSDHNTSMLTFYGLGQMYVLHISAWERHRKINNRHSNVHASLPETIVIPKKTEFVCDLTYLEKYNVVDGFEKYGSCAFFNTEKRLIAIYCSGTQEVVYNEMGTESGNLENVDQTKRPRGRQSVQKAVQESVKWQHAKYGFRSTMITSVTLREHLMFCHWIVAGRAHIATREELGKDHPIRRVLQSFLFRTGAINYVSEVTLMRENMLLHRASAFDYPALTKAFEDVADSFKYETFPEHVAEKNLPDDCKIPYVVDGLRLWEVMHDFFEGYVDLYFPITADVETDLDLIGYWKSMEKATKYGMGLPELNKKNLINQLTHIAFWVCGMHEMGGNVLEYFESPAFCGTRIRPKQVINDVQTFFQDLCVAGITGYYLPPLVSDWSHLFLKDDKNEAAVKLHGNFMGELDKLSMEIEDRNDNIAADSANEQGWCKRPFEAFNPQNLECSVSI